MFVIPSKISITGASLAAINIILGLLENRLEVYVVASEPPREYMIFLKKLEENGAKLFLVPSSKKGIQYWKTLATKAKEVIEEYDISIVHLHLPKLVYFLGNDLKKMNKKLILTVEGDPIFEVKELGFTTRFKTKILWNKCKKYSDIVCPCSEWLSKILKKRDKFPNVKTIHNPIDLNRFQKPKKNLRKQFGIPEEEFVVLTAARLTPVKNLDVLIKGYSIFFKKQNPKSRLIILGEGELQNELENLTKKLRIDNQVQFLGFKNNPQDYISISDVFVMSSKYEPFGMPAAEAGALEIPTIVSKTGGLTEIVVHEKTGFHFEVGNYEELAIYLEKLFVEPELRSKFGREAKIFVEKRFTPKVIGEKFSEIYSTL